MWSGAAKLTMERLPESFFDSALSQEAKALLSKLIPPATEVVMVHMDAPGATIVDFGSGQFASPNLVSPQPVLTNAPQRYRDEEIALSASVQGDTLVWEWTVAPRCFVWGRYPSNEWDRLRAAVADVRVALRALLPRP